MKKLMKAIAFATVMCMLLSTAAFAHGAVLKENAEKTLVITVTGATGDEQVALVVVEAGDEDISDGILYIDQKAAVAGTATFEAPIAASVSAVDIYAGSATHAAADSTGPVEVAKNVSIEGVKAITVDVSEKIHEDYLMSAAGDAVGAAVAMTVSFENVSNLSLTKVIFALQTNLGRKYTDSIDVAEAGLEVLEGSWQIAAAINNGTGGEKIATITDVDAIFLFEDAQDDSKDQEVFTNDADIKD